MRLTAGGPLAAAPLRGVVLVLGALWLSACEKPVTYAYFDVKVTLDRSTIDEDLLGLINSCAAIVEGDSNDAANLSCVRGQVRYDFGHFDYSTEAKQGKLKFIVKMKGLNQQDLAVGESAEVGIIPNVTVPVTVLVKAVPSAGDAPDAGSATDATTDGSTGSSTD